MKRHTVLGWLACMMLGAAMPCALAEVGDGAVQDMARLMGRPPQ